MKAQIKITYPGPLNVEVDKKITKAMELTGAKWWAQGTNLSSNERDICFDLEV